MAETAFQAVLLVLIVAFAGFMANRLYVGLSRRELNVKGALYARGTTPIAYWLSMACAFLGLLGGLLMVFGMGGGLLGLV